jgi:hypothetical protein
MTMFDQQWIGSTGKSLGPLKKGGQGSIHAPWKEFGWEGRIHLVGPIGFLTKINHAVYISYLY